MFYYVQKTRFTPLEAYTYFVSEKVVVKIALGKQETAKTITNIKPLQWPTYVGRRVHTTFPLALCNCATCLKKNNIVQRIAFTRWYSDWKCMFYSMPALKKSFPFSLIFLDILIIHSKKSNTSYCVIHIAL